MPEIELMPHIPVTGSYKIFYPKDFIITEDENAIVTITSPKTHSNLTLSGYNASLSVDEKVLSDFFNDFTEDYTPLSEIKKSITDKRLWLERKFQKDRIHWICWALSEDNQIILVTVNSDYELDMDDYKLYIFMLDKMEIYPSKFED